MTDTAQLPRAAAPSSAGGPAGDSPARTAPGRAVELGVLGALVALAAALRFATIDDQSTWLDEVATVQALRPSLGETLDAVAATESTPPLYYTLLWAWTEALGTGDVALRSLSALFGVAMVPVAWAAGRAAAGSWTGLAFAALVAANPAFIWFSHDARAYGLYLTLGLVTLWLFLRARRRPTHGNLALWALAGVAAVSTHYFSAFLIAGEALVLLWPRGTRVRVLAWGAVPAMAGALLAVLAAGQADGRAGWIAAADPLARLSAVVKELASASTWVVSSNSPPPGGWWAVVGTGAVAAAVVAALVAARRPGAVRELVAVTVTVCAVAIGLPLLLIPTPLDFFLDRNVMAAHLAFYLLVAIGAAAVPDRRAGAAIVTAACIAGIGVTAKISGDPSLQRDDWRSAAQVVDRVDVPAAVVTTSGHDRALTAIGRYLPDASPLQAPARVQEIVVVRSPASPSGGPPDPLATARRVAGRGDAPRLRLVGSQTVQRLGVYRFRAAGGPFVVSPPAGEDDPVLLQAPSRR